MPLRHHPRVQVYGSGVQDARPSARDRREIFQSFTRRDQRSGTIKRELFKRANPDASKILFPLIQAMFYCRVWDCARRP